MHPERVEEELAARGLGPEAELTVDQVAAFDQMHYYGNVSVAGAVGRLGLGPGSRVIDIGSGFGGPARYLAQKHRLPRHGDRAAERDTCGCSPVDAAVPT